MVAAKHPSLAVEQFDRFARALRDEPRYFGRSVIERGPKASPRLVHRLLTGDGIAFVAVADGDIVGMARLEDDAEGAELSVAVIERWRGRGVGRELASATVSHGRRVGYRRVVMRSSHRSRAALSLGRALGFEVVDMGRGRVDLVARLAFAGVPA